MTERAEIPAEDPGEADEAAGSNVPAENQPETPPSASPDGQEADSTKASTATPPRKKRRWLRWLRNVALVLLVLLLILRVAVQWFLPEIIDSQLAPLNLRCNYERLDVSLLGLDVELWQLELGERDAPDPLLRLEYLRADVAVLELLQGNLVVRRVEVDGLDLLLERTTDGRWRGLPELPEAAPAEPGAAADTPAGPAQRIDLASPVRLDAMRMQHVQLRLLDHTTEPALDVELELNLRLSDLGSSLRPLRLELSLLAPGLLEALTVRGQARSSSDLLRAGFDLHLAGLHPMAVQSALRPLGLEAYAAALQAGGRLDLEVEADTLQPGSLDARLALSRMWLDADSARALTLDSVAVHARLDSVGVDLPRVAVRGLRAHAHRAAAGDLAAAGLRLVPPPASEPGETEPAAEQPVRTQSVSDTTAPFLRRIASVELDDLRLLLVDHALQPSVPIELVLDSLRVGGFDLDPAHAQRPVTVLLAARSPGILGSLRLDVRATPLASPLQAGVDVSLDGLCPDRLQPYLQALGIESELEDARLRLRIDARVQPGPGDLRVDARLVDLHFGDGQELFALGEVRLQGLQLDSLGLAIDSLRVAGLRLPASLEPGGAVRGLGFLLRPPPPAAEDPADQTQPGVAPGPTGQASAAVPMRIALGTLLLESLAVALSDNTRVPAVPFELAELGLQLQNLELLPEATSRAAPLAIWLRAPGLAERVDLQGSLRPGLNSADLDLALTASGLGSAKLTDYLEPLGLRPQLEDASLRMQLLAGVAMASDGLELQAGLRDVELVQADTSWMHLDSLRVALRQSEQGIFIEPLEVVGASLTAHRGADSALVVLGMRLGSPPPDSLRSTGTDAAQDVGPRQTTAAAAPPAIELAGVRITGAALHWLDQTQSPALGQSLQAHVSLGRVVLPETDRAIPFSVLLQSPGSLDSLLVAGNLQLSPEAQTVAAQLSIRGMRAGALAAYLPPPITSELRDGRLDLGLHAAHRQHPLGGARLELGIDAFDYRDGDDAPSLLRFDELALRVGRLDLDSALVQIDALRLQGLSSHARTAADSSLLALGMRVRPPAPGVTPTDSSALTVAPPPPTAAPARAPAARPALPLIGLDTLEIGLQGLSFSDERDGLSRQVVLDALRVFNLQPIRVFGPDPSAQPAIELGMLMQMLGSLDSLSLVSRLDPFALQPEVWLQIEGSGLQGSGLAELVPALDQSFDASTLVDGRFRAELELLWKLRRRDPMAFDLTSSFGAEAWLRNISFRDGDGPVLIGVDEVFVDVTRVHLPSSEIAVELVSVHRPQAYLIQDSLGMQLLGMRLRPPPPPDSSDVPPPMPVGSGPRVVAQDTGNISLAKLKIEDIDVSFHDFAAKPAMHMPLQELNFSVEGFSTRGLREPLPITFQMRLEPGSVPDPRDASAAKIRPFESFELQGAMTLSPPFEGQVRVELQTLELVPFQGPAAAAGVIIEGGRVETQATIDFLADASIDIDADVRLNDVDISEPADGPISQVLQLTAPVDWVLWALQDNSGNIFLPLSFNVASTGLSAAQIAKVAVSALSSLITDALTNVPFRTVGTFTDLLGITGGEEQAPQVETLELQFAAGATGLQAAEWVRLPSLVQRLLKSEKPVIALGHTLGADDIARASLLANPQEELCQQLVETQRRRKALMLSEREVLLSEAEAAFAAQQAERGEQLSMRLRGITNELGLLDRSIDQLLQILSASGARQQTRRTREAALKIAAERLHLVRARLIELGVPPEAIRVGSPRFAEDAPPGGGKLVIKARF